VDEKKSYQLLQFAEDHDGYVSVSEAKRFGLHQTYLVQGEEEGQFVKVCKGLYIRKGTPIDPYYILHFRYPKAVFCLTTAAYLYHWIDEDESKPQVKLPRNYMTKGLPGYQCSHESLASYGVGIGLALTDHGQFVPATDKERTLIDIVLHEKDYDIGKFRQIVTSAFHDGLDYSRLNTYAEQFGAQLTIALLIKLLG